MKKILSLVLCLMMLLPIVALGESEYVTMDIGDYTMDVLPTDICLTGAKTDGGQMFQMFVNYDEAANFHPNMVGAWMSQDMGPIFDLGAITPADFAGMMLEQAVGQLKTQGIVVNGSELLDASYADGVMVLTFSMDVDYTGAGVDLVMTLVQRQIYVMRGEAGTYLFNLGSDSVEAVDDMMVYYNSIQFK